MPKANRRKRRPKRQKKDWIFDREKTILGTPIMGIYSADARATGSPVRHRFFYMRAPDWCNVIPVTEDGNVVLVKQFRVGIRARDLEIPGGIIDRRDRDAKTAALREMVEETGYELTPDGTVRSLGRPYPNPAILNNRVHLFAAGPVRKRRAQRLDPTEMIDVVEVPIRKIPTLILSGKISHALMLNAFFLLGLHSETGGLGLVGALSDLSSCDRLRSRTSRKRRS